jgi:hypothetical protein
VIASDPNRLTRAERITHRRKVCYRRIVLKKSTPGFVMKYRFV